MEHDRDDSASAPTDVTTGTSDAPRSPSAPGVYVHPTLRVTDVDDLDPARLATLFPPSQRDARWNRTAQVARQRRLVVAAAVGVYLLLMLPALLLLASAPVSPAVKFAGVVLVALSAAGVLALRRITVSRLR